MKEKISITSHGSNAMDQISRSYRLFTLKLWSCTNALLFCKTTLVCCFLLASTILQNIYFLSQKTFSLLSKTIMLFQCRLKTHFRSNVSRTLYFSHLPFTWQLAVYTCWEFAALPWWPRWVSMVSIHGGPGLEPFPSMLLFPTHTKNMFTHADASINNV